MLLVCRQGREAEAEGPSSLKKYFGVYFSLFLFAKPVSTMALTARQIFKLRYLSKVTESLF